MFDEVCPCKGCVPPERTATCHSECEKYKEWVKVRKEYTDLVEIHRHAEQDYHSVGTNRRRRKMIWEHLN